MNNGLFIICGLPGVGKTTVAKKIARKKNAFLVRSDVVRKKLFKKPTYSSQEKQKVYEEMFRLAEKELKKGCSVVLDATFHQRQNRKNAKKLAQKFKIEFKIIEVICSDQKVKERISKRIADESEAKFETFMQYKKYFQPIKARHFIINNSGSFRDIERILEKLSL